MPRTKRGKAHIKHRKSLHESTKGYYGRRKSGIKAAKGARLKAEYYAHRDRKEKKRSSRRLWAVHINSAAKLNGTNYSTIISALKKKNIALDRKILSELAGNHPELFKAVLKEAGIEQAPSTSL